MIINDFKATTFLKKKIYGKRRKIMIMIMVSFASNACKLEANPKKKHNEMEFK